MGAAMELALANNLGLLLAGDTVTSARGQEWVELSRLLPRLGTRESVHRLQESIAITGINLPGVPALTDPFTYYDFRIFLNQRIFDLESIYRKKAAGKEVTAARLSEADAREVVVVAVGAAYLQALAGGARVATVQAQVATAQTLLANAVELHKAGVTAGIDELRARVEYLTRTQELVAAQNDLAKEKLALVRLIGLPVDQEIVLSDSAPYRPAPLATPESLLPEALRCRADYRAAVELLDAAVASRRAARAQHLPSLSVDADYGFTGLTLSSLQGTHHVVGSLNLPIFEGGRIHGEVLRADALVRQRQQELADLKGQVEYQLRTALLDIGAAAKQVEVARESVQLAELALSQARERFVAGINDNLEVVQAQQSVAAAHEALISSLYRYNLSRLLLARAVGTAEEGGAGIGGE